MLGLTRKAAVPSDKGSAKDALRRLEMVIRTDRAANIPKQTLELIREGFIEVLQRCLGIDDCELDLQLCPGSGSEDESASSLRAEIPLGNVRGRK